MKVLFLVACVSAINCFSLNEILENKLLPGKWIKVVVFLGRVVVYREGYFYLSFRLLF